jgi:hypothetical protein
MHFEHSYSEETWRQDHDSREADESRRQQCEMESWDNQPADGYTDRVDQLLTDAIIASDREWYEARIKERK